MDLSVKYQQSSGAQDAFEKAKSLITPEYIAKYGVSPDITFDESTPSITATGTGFTMKLIFVEGECQVELKLNFLLKAFRGKILEGVERKLSKHL